MRPGDAKNRDHWLEHVVVLTVVVVLIASNLIWFVRDRSVWPWDQAWYGQTALDLLDAGSRGPINWIWAMVRALGSKPPLLPWLAQLFVPLAGLFGGRVEPAMLLVNVLGQGVAFTLIFQLARRLECKPVEALTAPLIACGGSIVIGLSNQFLVETLLDMTCVLMMWQAWSANDAGGRQLSGGLVIVIALGFLTKASAFVFIGPYLVYVIVARLTTRGEARKRNRGTFIMIPLAGASAVACLAWYIQNWVPMTQHFVDSTSSQMALLYGPTGSLSSKLAFWSRAAAIGLSPWQWLALGPVILILIALASSIPGFLRQYPFAALKEATRSGWFYAAASAGLVVVTLLGLLLQVDEETRFASTIYAPLGIATAWALKVLARPIVSFLTAGVFVLNAIWNIGISEGVLASPWPHSVWLKPYDGDEQEAARLHMVVAATCPPDHDPYYRIIGVEYPSFNANSASFYAAIQRRKQGSTCPFTSLGYAETNQQRALTRIESLKAEKVIFISPSKQPPADAFNAVSLGVVQSLQSNPDFILTRSQDFDVWIFSRRHEDARDPG